MKFILISSALALVSTVAAAPAPLDLSSFFPFNQQPKCLTQSAADYIVSKFISFIQHTNIPAANATGQALFSEGYTEVSDSILSLEGQPVCSLVLTS